MHEHRRLEPDAGPVLGDVPRKERQWTFMVYLAGDNNLEFHGHQDLWQMKRVGSNDELAIVAQLDTRSLGPARRYYITAEGGLEDDEVGADLGEINTGDPAELMRFAVWAMETYPARHYALVIWNHGTGWKEDDIYELVSDAGLPYQQTSMVSPRQEQAVSTLMHEAQGPQGVQALFKPSLETILARGIAYDDTARDFLDNAQLKQAIGCSLAITGVDRFDLLGFDACLMNMVEVAYQVRDAAQMVVGSQEVEPAAGWPYDHILAALKDRPRMGADELATLIVVRYMSSYGPLENLTQSALQVSRVQELAASIDALCDVVLSRQQETELGIYRAARRAQFFADPDYKDLYDFCRLIAEIEGPHSELSRQAEGVMALLEPSGPDSFVLASAQQGYRMRRAHGVSIYFPQRVLSPFYRRLDFASDSLWDDLLLRLVGV
jgi:hypothetical protein